jgi:predicted metal-binding protein
MRSHAGRGAPAPVGLPCMPISHRGAAFEHPSPQWIAHGATRVTSTINSFDPEHEVAVPTTIFVCITCRRAEDSEAFPRPGATLAQLTATAAEGSGIAVKRVQCLANCHRGLSAAVRRHDAWTYVFGDLNPAVDGAALVEGARLLARSSDGLMPWRGRPTALKRGLIARVPPIDFPEDVE